MKNNHAVIETGTVIETASLRGFRVGFQINRFRSKTTNHCGIYVNLDSSRKEDFRFLLCRLGKGVGVMWILFV